MRSHDDRDREFISYCDSMKPEGLVKWRSSDEFESAKPGVYISYWAGSDDVNIDGHLDFSDLRDLSEWMIACYNKHYDLFPEAYERAVDDGSDSTT